MPKPPSPPPPRSPDAARAAKPDDGPRQRAERRTGADPLQPPAPARGAWAALAQASPARLLRAMFVDQVKLRRDGLRVRVELAADTAAQEETQAASAVAPATPAEQMRRELGKMLDNHPGSRDVLKHLAALEHLLATRTDAFIPELSVASLQAMLRQMHGLLTPPVAHGVALLLTELHDAVETKIHEESLPGPVAISSFFVDHKLEVTELSDSALAAMEGELPTMPGRAPPR